MNKMSEDRERHLIGLLNNAIQSAAECIFDPNCAPDEDRLSYDVANLTTELQNSYRLILGNSSSEPPFQAKDVGALIVNFVKHLHLEDRKPDAEEIKDLAQSAFDKIFNPKKDQPIISPQQPPIEQIIADATGMPADVVRLISRSEGRERTPSPASRRQQSTPPRHDRTKEGDRLSMLHSLQTMFEGGNGTALCQAFESLKHFKSNQSQSGVASSNNTNPLPSPAPTDPSGQPSSSSKDSASRP